MWLEKTLKEDAEGDDVPLGLTGRGCGPPGTAPVRDCGLVVIPEAADDVVDGGVGGAMVPFGRTP